ncbi:MAG: transcriptional regulator [Nocardioides sp.]|nr:transcriptional regulator [Nocardioides sp.]
MSAFEVVRSTTVHAAPARVHALVDDFHAWPAWSPWEDVDPTMQRTYSGPATGVGAHYAWSGNRKAGRGSMEIVSSTPEEIGIRLAFLKPWKATNDVTFTMVPQGAGTEVTWRMTGEHKGFGVVVAKVVPMDRLVGKDFETGLTRLKAAAES